MIIFVLSLLRDALLRITINFLFFPTQFLSSSRFFIRSLQLFQVNSLASFFLFQQKVIANEVIPTPATLFCLSDLETSPINTWAGVGELGNTRNDGGKFPAPTISLRFFAS
jgi:hypothetical protein